VVGLHHKKEVRATMTLIWETLAWELSR